MSSPRCPVRRILTNEGCRRLIETIIPAKLQWRNWPVAALQGRIWPVAACAGANRVREPRPRFLSH
eukprot:scaffold128000_cov48-Phaeocystis_antarctica.AAC.1